MWTHTIDNKEWNWKNLVILAFRSRPPNLIEKLLIIEIVKLSCLSLIPPLKEAQQTLIILMASQWLRSKFCPGDQRNSLVLVIMKHCDNVPMTNIKCSCIVSWKDKTWGHGTILLVCFCVLYVKRWNYSFLVMFTVLIIFSETSNFIISLTV